MNSPLLLFVDDVPINLEIARAQCESLSLACRVANSASEAIEVVRQQPISLIVTDLSMPGMNGMELARVVRQTPAGQTLPIIGLTTNRQLLEETPAELNEILEKPMEVAVLKDLVNRYLNGQPPASSSITSGASTLAIVDLDLLGRLLGSDSPSQCVEWLEYFRQTFPGLLEELRIALERRDREGIAERAHAAKGAARSAAATQVAGKLGEIEQAASTSSWSALETAIQAVESEFSRVRVYIDRLESDAR